MDTRIQIMDKANVHDTMDYYLAIKNNDMKCAGKWVELEKLILR